MTTIKKLNEELRQIDQSAIQSTYYLHPIPSMIDDRIEIILNQLVTLNQNEINNFLNALGDEAIILSVFAERMASLSIRNNCVDLVKKGLLALIIASYVDDDREILLILSLLHDALLKLKISPLNMFNEVGSLVGRQDFLQKYLNREDKDKTIEVMGYIETQGENGFLYKRTW